MYFIEHEADPIFVIARPKLQGPGEHFGVRLPNGIVVDCSWEAPIRSCSEQQFSAGMDVTIKRSVPKVFNNEIRRRLKHAMLCPRPYDPVKWNCEIFANWLTCAPPESAQVASWTFLCVLAGAGLMLMA